MLAGMHLFCGWALAVVARAAPRSTGAPAPARDPVLAPLRRNRLIRGMALLVLLVAKNAALLDYLLKAAAAEAVGKDELVHFFSSFYVAVGLGGFLPGETNDCTKRRWLIVFPHVPSSPSW